MTDNKEKLIELIESKPKLLKIIQSKEHIQILQEIYKEPQKNQDLKLKTSFKNVSILYNILDTLIQSNLVKKMEIDEEYIYFLTDKGKELIELYNLAKNKFDLNGGE
jgi:DNA-binding HxlR family transcriptional regulator